MQRSSRTKAGSRPFFIRRRNIVRLQTIENLTVRLTEQLGHPPADEEVAGMLAMSVQKLQRLRTR